VKPGNGESLYLIIGDTPALLCLLLTAGVALIVWFKRKNIHKE
jgi:hypothetical protein